MLALDLAHLNLFPDVLRSRAGAAVTVRFAAPNDAEALQAYFRGLSIGARYNRLMGAASELPAGQLDAFTHLHDDGRFSVVATVARDGVESIVGEARYALDHDSTGFELGLSVADAFHGQGLGAALMANLECRAAALGAGRMFGDTLRSNAAMLALALKSGFAFAPTPNDWKQVRFSKRVTRHSGAAAHQRDRARNPDMFSVTSSPDFGFAWALPSRPGMTNVASADAARAPE